MRRSLVSQLRKCVQAEKGGEYVEKNKRLAVWLEVLVDTVSDTCWNNFIWFICGSVGSNTHWLFKQVVRTNCGSAKLVSKIIKYFWVEWHACLDALKGEKI